MEEAFHAIKKSEFYFIFNSFFFNCELSSFYLILFKASCADAILFLFVCKIIIDFVGCIQYTCMIYDQNDSSAHLFSSIIWASSSGVKSFSILKNSLISGMVMPLMRDATLAHASSSKLLISMKLAARMSSKRTSCSMLTKLAYQSLTTSLS